MTSHRAEPFTEGWEAFVYWVKGFNPVSGYAEGSPEQKKWAEGYLEHRRMFLADPPPAGAPGVVRRPIP